MKLPQYGSTLVRLETDLPRRPDVRRLGCVGEVDLLVESPDP